MYYSDRDELKKCLRGGLFLAFFLNLILLATHSASYYLFSNHQEEFGEFSNYFESTFDLYLIRASLASVLCLVMAYGTYRKGKKDNLRHLK